MFTCASPLHRHDHEELEVGDVTIPKSDHVQYHGIEKVVVPVTSSFIPSTILLRRPPARRPSFPPPSIFFFSTRTLSLLLPSYSTFNFDSRVRKRARSSASAPARRTCFEYFPPSPRTSHRRNLNSLLYTPHGSTTRARYPRPATLIPRDTHIIVIYVCL